MAASSKASTKSMLFAEERHAQILSLLQEKQKIRVTELCQIYNVSPATIRNDLRELEKQDLLQRTHGGAIVPEKTSFEPLVANRVENLEAKQKIAACAAKLVEDGDTIAIDAGSTMMELAKNLVGRNGLTVLTNDIRIAGFLEKNSVITIVLIGGLLRHGYECTIGPMATSSISTLNVDKAFIGANAFSIEKGFTTPDISQAEVKRALIQSARQTIVLCDSHKFGRVSFAEFATLQDVNSVITDSQLNPKIASYMQTNKQNVDFVMV